MVIEEMKKAGFIHVENMATQHFAYYKAVLSSIYTIKEFGKEHFEKGTTLGPALKEIIYKIANQYNLI